MLSIVGKVSFINYWPLKLFGNIFAKETNIPATILHKFVKKYVFVSDHCAGPSIQIKIVLQEYLNILSILILVWF